ncbi:MULTISPECIES: ATP-binding protein [Myxococcus]|uniref:ATP-binding protein n=1 Tax=Myxococcus TaxID=32 RepID=UPI0013D2D3DC|nr:ATP-binding protein [Myxococcus eversor]NVJ22073.1 HAMP domain-containing protein [Myxococcus sp. AM011]
MDRLFLRVYLHIFAGVLIAGLAARVFVIPVINAQLARNLEATFAVPVGLMAELFEARYREHGDFGGPAEQASRRFGVPVALIPQGRMPLDAESAARLEGGQVVRVGPVFASMLYARLEGTGHVLEVGPLPLNFPLGGARGLALGLCFVGGLSLGVFMLLRPVRRQLLDLRRTAEALGRGELGARAEVGSRDVIGALSTAVNHMGAELQRSITLRDELLHNTSHELRAPSQRLHFSLALAREASEPAEREQAFDRVERSLSELDQLVDELLTYARLKAHRAPKEARADVRPVLAALCATLASLPNRAVLAAPGPGPGDEPLVVRVEARLIERATSNLILNALRYANSQVQVSLSREGHTIHIHVDDDGPGIPLAERERVFEPFHRLDDERHGFGLGLAIVHRIAEVHGGRVSALGSVLGGARFTLSFPA